MHLFNHQAHIGQKRDNWRLMKNADSDLMLCTDASACQSNVRDATCAEIAGDAAVASVGFIS